VPIPLTREWRERDLQKRLQTWTPRVGERATRTFARGRHLLIAGVLTIWVWLLLVVGLGVAGLTGDPILIATFLLWPPYLFLSIKGLRLSTRGMHQAAEVVAVSNKVAVPMRSAKRFDAWVKESKYSRFATAAPQDES
jgi:hypothetical protein